MAAKRTFISFDFDHDQDLKILLAGHAKNPDTVHLRHQPHRAALR